MNNEMYVVHVTKECNMKCLYCYEQDKTSAYSWEEIKKTVDNIIKYRTSDNFDIEFLGGEPMIEWGYIKNVYEYIESSFTNLEVSYIITTNGTILNDKIIDYLNNNRKINFSISLDGTKLSNQLRLLKNNENSYDKVAQNIKKLQEKNINPSIHITTHPFNIAFLKDSVLHLYNDLNINHIGIGTIESSIEIDERYTNRFLKELDSISKEIVENNLNLKIDLFQGVKPEDDVRSYIRDSSGKVVAESYGRSGDDISHQDSIYNIDRITESKVSETINFIRKRAFLNHKINSTKLVEKEL